MDFRGTSSGYGRPYAVQPAHYYELRNIPVTWALSSSTTSSYKYTASPTTGLFLDLDDNSYIYHKFSIDLSITTSSFTATDPDWWGNAEGGYDADYCPGIFESPVTPTAPYPEPSNGALGNEVIGFDCRLTNIVALDATNDNVPKHALIIPAAGTTHRFTASFEYSGSAVPNTGSPRDAIAATALAWTLNVHEAQFQSGLISGVTIHSSTLDHLLIRKTGGDEVT